MTHDDCDYIEIGSLPLAEWMDYWRRGNDAVWDGDLHDVQQLREELSEASGYVRKLLADNSQFQLKCGGLIDDLAMEREAHMSALNRCAALRDALEKIAQSIACGGEVGLDHTNEAPIYRQWNLMEFIKNTAENAIGRVT